MLATVKEIVSSVFSSSWNEKFKNSYLLSCADRLLMKGTVMPYDFQGDSTDLGQFYWPILSCV